MSIVWIVLGVWALLAVLTLAFVAGCASMEPTPEPIEVPDFIPEWMLEDHA